MVFSSSTFLFLFLPIVLVGYGLFFLFLPKLRNTFLLIASLLFYGYGEPVFVLIMIGSILLNYLAALLIGNTQSGTYRKLLLAGAVSVNLLLLIFFKYTNFITANLGRFFERVPRTNIALPIGISFFTFQAMSYVIDVYRGEEAQKNPLDLGLYIAFFPQLIAGPIVRYNTIAEEIRNRKESWAGVSEGVIIFLRGLAKKVIFANNMAIIADRAFAGAACDHSVLFSWLGAVAYTFQIYYDFSGYSDMATGLGRIFGFHFPANFNYPYIASSITDFWRRWHISLSTWFRDYVYIPLGGSRGSSALQIRNLFVVWMLTGLWHGANWTFILWGLLYFLMLAVEKMLIRPQRLGKKAARLYRIPVMIAVILCWVLFRASSVRVAGQYLKSMLGLYGNPLSDGGWLRYSREYAVLLIGAALASTPIVRCLLRAVRSRVNGALYGTLRTAGYVFIYVICVSYLVMGAHNPFIYFNF